MGSPNWSGVRFLHLHLQRALLWRGESPSPGASSPYDGYSSNPWAGVSYIFNISVLGALSCILLFLFVKLQDDHRLPEFVHLFHKLLAVWHTTDEQIARVCGADASNYLALLRTMCFIFAVLSIPSLLVILPINLYCGDLPVSDQIIQTTVSHIHSGSPWLWVHMVFVCISIAFSHFALNRFEGYLHSTRYRELDTHDTVSAFTIMIRGIPSQLVNNKKLLWDYFEHLYPGKVFRVYIPPNLVSFVQLCKNFKSVLTKLKKAKAKAVLENMQLSHASQTKPESMKKKLSLPEMSDQEIILPVEEREEQRPQEGDGSSAETGRNQLAHFSMSSFHPRKNSHSHSEHAEEETTGEGGNAKKRKPLNSNVLAFAYVTVTYIYHGILVFSSALHSTFECLLSFIGDHRRWFWIFGFWNWSDEVVHFTKKLHDLRHKMESYLDSPKDGADVAFVVFRDVFTATRALRDVNSSHHSPDPSLATWRWKCERAAPPGKVQWSHVGSSAWRRRLRSFTVNSILSLVLVFWSSPLAMLTAMNSASEKLDPDAMEHFHSWLAWAKGTSWFAATLFQFLPNLLLFLSMSWYIPMVLAKLSKFELHLTLSGEQRAVLIKMVCFLFLNLFLLKALVESTLESAIVDLGQCYSDPSNCEGKSHWMKSNFIGNSSLSAIAFFITSSLLGVSLDLLSPYAWFKRHYKRIKKKIFSHYSSSAVRLGSFSERKAIYPLQPTNRVDQDSADHVNANDASMEGVAPLETTDSLLHDSSDSEETTPKRSVNVEDQKNLNPQFFFTERIPSSGNNLSELGIPLLDNERSKNEVLENEITRQIPEQNAKENDQEEGIARDPEESFYKNPILFRLFHQKISKGFDYPQSHSFNLTAFGISLFYSTIAPLVLPFSIFFFSYRLCVDKYNLLSMHRLSDTAVSSDGKLMGTVLKVLRMLLFAYSAFMVVFLWLRGDTDCIQMLFMFMLFVFFFVKYGMEKLVLNDAEKGLDGYFVQGVGSVNRFLEGDDEWIYDIDIKAVAKVFLQDSALEEGVQV